MTSQHEILRSERGQAKKWAARGGNRPGPGHWRGGPTDTAEGTRRDGRELVKTSTPGVYKRGSGYVVRFRDPQGKQRQRAARTLAEARRLRSELTTDVVRGECRPDTKITFAAYADSWKGSYAGRTSRGLRPETMESYKRGIDRAVDHFGRGKLAEIGPADIKGYARALSNEGLSPGTVRRYLAPVKAMLATATEDGLLRANPSAGLRLGTAVVEPVDREEQVKALTPEQLSALIETTPEGPRRTMLLVMAPTGLRLSEVLGLRWSSFDRTGRLRVRERVREGRAGPPKSRASAREVPISASLARELAELRLMSPYSRDEDFIFPSSTGRAQFSRNLYRWFKPTTEKAGAPWAGFHTLRHTAASRWLLSGVTIAQVALLLGHEDPSFTLRTYIHMLPRDLPDGDHLARAVGLT